jgi:hypothetical protein
LLCFGSAGPVALCIARADAFGAPLATTRADVLATRRTIVRHRRAFVRPGQRNRLRRGHRHTRLCGDARIAGRVDAALTTVARLAFPRASVLTLFGTRRAFAGLGALATFLAITTAIASAAPRCPLVHARCPVAGRHVREGRGAFDHGALGQLARQRAGIAFGTRSASATALAVARRSGLARFACLARLAGFTDFAGLAHRSIGTRFTGLATFAFPTFAAASVAPFAIATAPAFTASAATRFAFA